ncbi:hypothetical protein CLOSAC_35860 [Clostridium saccharobutylicum]|uniref:Uncharacterized protein n=1 Tax=Clostridium saccharobutylicum TaxID=169679 RepID=A0A1S8MYR9_CLOSA|nr:hypothetical protein CLOSAC_35860 [Clostridium saccharobutylicum]
MSIKCMKVTSFYNFTIENLKKTRNFCNNEFAHNVLPAVIMRLHV